MTTITYPDATLKIADTATTKNSTITENGVVVSNTIFGTDYTNTILADQQTITNAAQTAKTRLQASDINLTNTTSGNNLALNLGFTNAPTISLTAVSPNDPPDFPSQLCRLTTGGLEANNSFGWNLNVAKLALDGNLSTQAGQVITSNSTGRPIWATPPAIVSTQPFYITATSPLFQVPPVAPPSSIVDTYQYYGWYFINSSVGRKISWYFAPDYAMTVGDIQGLYMNYFNITATSNDDLPFISVYTKPTGTNDVIPGFAHSVATYVPTFTPIVNTPYCSFMNISGVEPDPFPYGHQLGAMILSPVQPNPRGQYLPTEEVLAISVGTSSSSTTNQVSFVMSKVGVCLTQGNAELILYPQNIYNLSATTVTATTSMTPKIILDKDGQAGTSGQVLSSTVTGLDWITLSSPATPNIGQVITAGGDAGGGSITNLASLTATTSIKPTTILDLNNQAGTAGQLLSSTATGIDWVDAPSSGWVGTATSNLDMDNYSIVDVNNVGMVNGTLTASSSTVATSTTTVANTGVVVSRTIFGTDYTNTILADQQTITNAAQTAKTKIQPSDINLTNTTSGNNLGLNLGFTNAPTISLTAVSPSDPPEFPSQLCRLTTGGLEANNSFGWNLNVAKLLLNSGASTTGQVITADSNGRPVWGTPATPYISASGVASGGITSLPSINASGAMTIGNNVATTGLTIGSGNYTTAMGGNVGFGGNNISGLNSIDGNSAVLAIGTQATTTNVSIGKAGQDVNVAGSLKLGGNAISGVISLDGNNGTLSIGRESTTTNSISIGQSGVAIDLNNTVRFGASGAVSAGTAGQVVTSGGAGAFTRWANIALTNVAGTAEQPNAGNSVPFQLFTSTAITGTIGSTYMFNFRTNITSASGTESNELVLTLTTTAGAVTPTTSNSFNVLFPSVNILTTRPDELTSLAMTKHYSTVTGRQDRTLTFTYLYTFTASTTITFGVWSWAQGSAGVFTRKNIQLGYVKVA